MAHRRIEDPQQQMWDVWEVVPSRMTGAAPDDKVGPVQPTATAHAPRRLVVPAEMQAGWLAFQSEHERRRLVPVPPGWESLPNESLLQLLIDAPIVQPRRRAEEMARVQSNSTS